MIPQCPFPNFHVIVTVIDWLQRLNSADATLKTAR